MAEPKVYVGKGWKKEFANGGYVINMSIKKEELLKLTPNQYGDIRLVIGSRKQPDEKSKATHWVSVDSFTPQESEKDLPF